MRKILAIFCIICILILIGCKKVPDNIPNVPDKPIGEEKDYTSCLEGYSFDDNIGACTRNLDSENKKKAAKMVVAPLSFPVTVTNVDETSVGNYIVTLQRNSNQEEFKVEIKNWQVLETAHVITLTKDQCERKNARTVNVANGAKCKDNEQFIGEVIGLMYPSICCREIVDCPDDTKTCDDGTIINRVPPYCNFPSCTPATE